MVLENWRSKKLYIMAMKTRFWRAMALRVHLVFFNPDDHSCNFQDPEFFFTTATFVFWMWTLSSSSENVNYTPSIIHLCLFALQNLSSYVLILFIEFVVFRPSFNNYDIQDKSTDRGSYTICLSIWNFFIHLTNC